MPGSVFLIALVVLGILVIVAGISSVFLIPIVVLGLALLFAAPILGLIRADERSDRRSGGTEPSGVPSTREASYDPVQEP
jgi:Flp pilus assembly protein TadB